MTMTDTTAATTAARKRYGDDCHMQVADGMLQARPLHGMEWHDVARVRAAGPWPTYAPPAGKAFRRLLKDLDIENH